MPPLPSPSSTLLEADGWWISTTCACERHADFPCRLLARWYGPDMTVGEVARRLMCKRCRLRPAKVELVDNPQLDAKGYVSNTRARRVPLRPQPTAGQP